MYNTKRVALVRKVRTTNSKLVLGVLAPCMELKGLVFTELCFGDDISIPYFVPLIKDELSGSQGDEDGIGEKDSLMDELIMSMALDDFTGAKGPVDPSIQVLRDNITRKILGKPISPVKGHNELALESPRAKDNIELYFENIVSRDDVVVKLKEIFPIKEVYAEKQIEKEKAATVVVRKRQQDPALAITNEPSGTSPSPVEKKVKLEDEESEKKPVLPFPRSEFNADFLVID